ncbi:tumor necrosis factor ligand superfamily member 14-like [Mugil cephalus]|uniref:tumor necrosis factor ligand superfamily member 14-like n=1 Tax=Mugil cephalus TaxID=48193 RepID=UPI001FB7055F|nr:tumor necrosis factor ligand superfamily member 14-like [Mugil cephalus]
MQRNRNKLDSTVVFSPLPQSPDEQQGGTKLPGEAATNAAQTLLCVMLSVVLCGIAIETYFISCFFHSAPAVSELISGDNFSVPVTGRDGRSRVLNSKPMAHLYDVSGVVHESQVMHWSLNRSLLHDMRYGDGRLEVQKEGYYFVYSKVSFIGSSAYYHSVMRFYPETTLMRSQSTQFGDSYLGGIFHFHKGQTIYVSVSNTVNTLKNTSFENFFGAFMI